jgi:hypothetical protein
VTPLFLPSVLNAISELGAKWGGSPGPDCKDGGICGPGFEDQIGVFQAEKQVPPGQRQRVRKGQDLARALSSSGRDPECELRVGVAVGGTRRGALEGGAGWARPGCSDGLLSLLRSESP